jgi:prepilin-type N-terminal cleavage/methylation domain-containing protein
MNDFNNRLANNVKQHRFGARCGRVAGFTLIEMLTVLTIVGILAMTAAPSFSPLIASKRAEAAATELYISLVTSRSEATKRNADATLAQKTGGWQLGWQVTVVDPTDATRTLTVDDHPAANGVTVSGPANVVYQSSGRVQGNTNPSFVVTAVHGSSTEQRWVCVDLSGRPLAKASSCP